MSEISASNLAQPSPPPGGLLLGGRHSRWLHADLVLHALALGSGLTIILMLGSLLVVLTVAAGPSMKQYGFRFLINSNWQPNEREVPQLDSHGKVMHDEDGEIVMRTIPPSFGALPMIVGTAYSSALALLIAAPLSLGAALFLVRIAPRFLVAPISFLVEFLAAIPSLAYGIWGLFVLAPFLRNVVEPTAFHLFHGIWGFGWLFYDHEGHRHLLTGLDMLCGGLILGIMIIPIITAISRDILTGVPRAQLEGTAALGATWWQSAVEMMRFSRSGLFGAIILGLARAAGETMAVTMVIGNNPHIAMSPFARAQTMSSLLASKFQEAEDLDRSALLEIALILLVMSLLFNVTARWLVVGKDSRGAAAH
jgi:phosphate transport system permease protein